MEKIILEDCEYRKIEFGVSEVERYIYEEMGEDDLKEEDPWLNVNISVKIPVFEFKKTNEAMLRSELFELSAAIKKVQSEEVKNTILIDLVEPYYSFKIHPSGSGRIIFHFGCDEVAIWLTKTNLKTLSRYIDAKVR